MRHPVRVPKQLAEIVKFSTKSGRLAESKRKAIEGLSNEEKEKIGLLLLYDRQMIKNNTMAASQGILSLKNLMESLWFGNDSATDGDELIARENYPLQEFLNDQALRPKDRRIDSWIASARIWAGEVTNRPSLR